MNITTNRIGDYGESSRIVSSLRISGKPCLDVGCGSAGHTKALPRCVFVDVDKAEGTPGEMIVWDIRDILNSPVGGMRFGTAYLLDVIEHITKEEGKKLLSDLQSISERVVLFTPLGELWISDDPSPHAHKSGWTPEDLPGWNSWTWPVFHKFADGNTHGAFWAWWSKDQNPSPRSVATQAKVTP